MNHWTDAFMPVAVGLVAGMASMPAARPVEPTPTLTWKRLPPVPDKEGFAGPFAGVTSGGLIVAGGANFPDNKPWEGGKKVWYRTIFLLNRPDGGWRVAGKLPRPLAYGVSVTYRGGVVCVGGGDLDRHYADVFRLEWKADKVITIPLPSLLRPVANACGTLVGDTLYLAGGQEKPDASDTLKTVYRIDLAAPKPTWQQIDAWPGSGRMLAVAAGFDGRFWLAGGVDLAASGGKVKRRYLNDACCYGPDKDWERIADLPHAVTAAPSPAPAEATGFYLLGGDDGSQVGQPPDRHLGFNRQILRYDLKTATWARAGAAPAAPVTVPCVRWGKSWVVPGGEVRPGVRSSDVWSMTFGARE